MMRKLLYSILPVAFALLQSCGSNGWESEPVSTDSVRLTRLINLHNFRPDSVRFQYSYIDNSGFPPGPSDYSIEVLLHFSDTTFDRLRKESRKLPPYTMSMEDNFAFQWLDKNTLAEVAARDSTSKEIIPDYFKGLVLSQGGYILLKNKVLLKLRNW